MKILLLVACCLPVLAGCQNKEKEPGVKKPTSVTVSPVITEASGIADSRTQPGALWVIEDSGNPPQLFLLGHDGKVQKTIPLQNAVNRDWEDVVVSGAYIYIADIGDNNQKYTSYKIYKAPEPLVGTAQITSFETIEFTYPDGAHDAEGFLVDPESGDIFIITKRDAAAQVYKIGASYSTTNINVAEKMGQLQFTGVVSAALSPDGGKLLVKTYAALYQFQRQKNEPVNTALQRTPVKVAYEAEPQGEAVCYKLDGSGYFTLSEQLLGSTVQLCFYKQ